MQKSTEKRQIKNQAGSLVNKEIDIQEETVNLRTRLELAEQSRLVGDPAFTVEQSKRHIKERLHNVKI